jgi:Lrp/AsnC family transcriptional regulator, regulator for asnA, asnC and gidA
VDRSLDDTDLALMRELEADGRASNVELARKVGLSEGAVRNRLERLFDSGAVQIVGIPDPRSIGLNTHAVICMQVEMQRLEEIEQSLVSMPELSFVYETFGPYDLIVVGFFPDVEELRSFLTAKVASLTGVIRTDTFHIMRTVKRSFRKLATSAQAADAAAGRAPARASAKRVVRTGRAPAVKVARRARA